MRFRSVHVAVIVVVVIFGTVAGSVLAGVWQTTGGGGGGPRVISEGAFAGMSDPEDIRGSYSFADIEAGYGVPIAVLAEAFGVDAADASLFAAKDLEEAYGEIGGMEIGTDTVRLFVALYMGIPYTPEETTALPVSAYRVLTNPAYGVRSAPATIENYRDRVLSPDGAEFVLPRIEVSTDESQGSDTAGESLGGGLSSETREEGDTGKLVRGPTTFADLLSWGLAREQIEAALGTNMPVRGTTIRDFAAEQGISFRQYRDMFQALLDSVE